MLTRSTAPWVGGSASHPLPTVALAVVDTPAPQVWLALEEKNIPYDSVLIELYNKPTWYKDLVPTSLVPAVVRAAAALLCQKPQRSALHYTLLSA